GHDAYRGSAINRLQATEDGSKEGFVFLGFAHVVDSENDDRLDVVLRDPLRRRQTRELAMRVVEVDFVEIGEAVAIDLGFVLSEGGGGEKEKEERVAWQGCSRGIREYSSRSA